MTDHAGGFFELREKKYALHPLINPNDALEHDKENMKILAHKESKNTFVLGSNSTSVDKLKPVLRKTLGYKKKKDGSCGTCSKCIRTFVNEWH